MTESKKSKDVSEEIDLSSKAPSLLSLCLLSLLPMLYIAWSDGVLTPTEIATIRKKLKNAKWLTQEEQNLLADWLDPANPPSAGRLLSWLKLIRNVARQIPDASRKSLMDLGLEISRIGAKSAAVRCTTPEACAALADVERALGIAHAFQRVGYPVNPGLKPVLKNRENLKKTVYGAKLVMRHYSQILPRDFDLSPNFEIIKFNIVAGGEFNYKSLRWDEGVTEKDYSAQSTEERPLSEGE